MDPWNVDAKFRKQFEAAFFGLQCTAAEKYGPDSWRFSFEGRTFLDAHCTWRIIASGCIVLANGDHDQQFGLPAPLDGQAEVLRLLDDKIDSVHIRDTTSDLVLSLRGGTALEILTDSSGYECWQCASTNGLKAVVQGGGNLVYWYAIE